MTRCVSASQMFAVEATCDNQNSVKTELALPLSKCRQQALRPKPRPHLLAGVLAHEVHLVRLVLLGGQLDRAVQQVHLESPS